MADPSPNPRLDQFRAEIAALRLKEPDPARDAQRLRVGGALIFVGVALGVIALLVSHGTTDPLTQRDAIIVALVGVSVSLGGVALYLRYGLTQFLRFWMARMLFESASAPSRNGVAPQTPPANASTVDPVDSRSR